MDFEELGQALAGVELHILQEEAVSLKARLKREREEPHLVRMIDEGQEALSQLFRGSLQCLDLLWA